MKRIIVIKDVLYATDGGGAITSINAVNTLAEGALAIFTEDGTLLTVAGAAAALPNKKRVVFAVGGLDAAGNKIARLTPYYSRTGYVNVTKKVYTAPVKPQILIGDGGAAEGALNNPTLTGSPQVAGIKVIDLSRGTQPPIRYKTYEEPVKTGDTMAAIMIRLMARIAADADAFVVSTDPSGTNIGLLITPSDFGITISVSCYGILSDADITVDGTGASTPMVIGTGTPAQITALWDELSSTMGNMNKVELANLWWKVSDPTNTAATYDMYWIQTEEEHETPSGRQGAVASELIIAMPAGAATLTQASFETILALIFGTTRVNFESGI